MDFVLYIIIGLILGLVIGILVSKSKSAKFEANNILLTDSIIQTKTELENERKKFNDLNSEFSRNKANYDNLELKLKEHKEEIGQLQEKFRIEFENLANSILEEKSRRFTDQNKENLDTILNPLKEKISDFERKVNDIYISDTKDRAALAEQIKQLHELNRMMSEDANNLTRALKGDTKTQGNWGEFILENILDKSGLVKGREFTIQETLRNEEGEMLRPDVIVKLPEEKSIIIDSKVSITAYEAYCSADNDDIREKNLNEHLSSIRKHLKELSPKDYQNLYGLQSLDFVLMFIPIEPAFALAVQNDQSLFYDAFEKNIVIVSPSTLLATLRTISSIWKQEKQNKNALEIAKKSGDLYDKLASFVEDLIKVGQRMDDAKKSYEDAMKKLSAGKGNIITRAENLKLMGAKASKSIDQRIVDRSDEDDDSDLKLINTQ